jgi:hypothetical protein
VNGRPEASRAAGGEDERFGQVHPDPFPAGVVEVGPKIRVR